jgi:hypothetical protein
LLEKRFGLAEKAMPRVRGNRAIIQQMLRAVPFRPFAISLDNGDRVIVEHPENIAFDPTPNGKGATSANFSVITSKLIVLSTFDAISSVTLVDRGV